MCDTTVADQTPICNLFSPVPDTDFRDFLAEVASAHLSDFQQWRCRQVQRSVA